MEKLIKEDKAYNEYKRKLFKEREKQNKFFAYNELMFRVVRQANIEKLQGRHKERN